MSSWSKLQLPNTNPTPPLLYKYVTSNLGCEIYVTDLAYIWSQSLNRREILNNAHKYNTSIDPSEDEEQYFVLLHKISDALRGSEGSSLFLTSASRGEELELATSTKLPAPLDPLEWTFTLSQQSPNALTKHILLPILRGEANHEARIVSLIGHVKQKDWALSKLFDKLESSGVEPSTVFPSMGGVRFSQKESIYSQASKHIKGVAPFDEDLWNNEYQAKDSDYNLGVHIANELSSSSSFVDRPVSDFAPENWWNKLGAGSVAEPRQTAKRDKYQEKPAKRKSPSPAEKEEATQSDDDEFQTMVTPPRLRSPNRNQTQHNNQKHANSTSTRRAASGQDSKEGSPSSPTSYKSRSKHTGSVQATRSADSTSSSSEEEDDTRPAPKHSSKSKGLGMIGGKQRAKRKQSFIKSAESTRSVSESEAVAKPKPKPKPKATGALGAIGGRKNQKEQRQETPIDSTASDVSDVRSATTSPKQTKKTFDTDDIPTESENDTDLSISRPTKQKLPAAKERSSSPPLKSQLKSRGIGGIGQIGGKKKHPQQIAASDQPESAQPRQPSYVQDEDSDENGASTVHRQTSTKPKHLSGKLGIIGGRGKPPAPTSRKEHSPSTTNDENQAPDLEMPETSPPPRATAASTKVSQHQPAKLEEKEVEATPEAKEETPEERANRKREELKKQLEARNKGASATTGVGGPAKKRRRF
ncbi:hypothetical protein ACJ72_00343 [Emergomyces africanus]|uniref:Non-homologous end-joining factor 1 n=1 Tax=Emergomyces africanus TaxID=1955775 RepID=A0A1B7P8E6_9EURO|nr:hypothetical protein ACJ72_00343 [Emergomyces africanus]